MSEIDPDSLTKSQIRQMTRDELALVVMDFLQRIKEKSSLLIKENVLQEDLEKAHIQIEFLNEKIDSLTKELHWSLKQNKYLESQQIPKLQHEVENRSYHRTQLLTEIKDYKNKVKELQASLKNQERDSKLQVEKIEGEKRQMVSEMTAYQAKLDKQQNEMKKLEVEVSRKIDEIGIKNNELLKEKDKTKVLEARIKALEKYLKEAEKENKTLEKKIPLTPMEEAIERTKQEFKARVDLSSCALTVEKKRNRILKERLTKKEQEVSKLMEEQAETSKLLALQQKKEALAVKQSLAHTEYDWRDLKKENKCLNYQIKVFSESRQRDQQQIKEVTNQIRKVTEMYMTEKKQHENLKATIKSKGAKLEDKIDQTKAEIEIDAKQLKPLPPMQEKKNQLPKTKSICNRRILVLREGKIEPAFNDENLTTEAKLKPTPPSKRKPEMRPSTSAVRRPDIPFFNSTNSVPASPASTSAPSTSSASAPAPSTSSASTSAPSTSSAIAPAPSTSSASTSAPSTSSASAPAPSTSAASTSLQLRPRLQRLPQLRPLLQRLPQPRL
ncbi:girdin-like [Poecilia formosa]|uniref:girdin-like n=1 Tax=Poecilia formosa TaxID=48698 RepID=UPI0007B82210|nr:PREDICTED: girdin-like [Poecilia formosa]